MIRGSIILLVVAVITVLLILAIGPRLGEAKIERLNRRMIMLRDRVISNPSETNALNSLMASLHSRNSFERNAAIAFLGQIGPRAKPAVQQLVAVLAGSDPYDAREAARSLGEIGVNAKEAVPALIKAVKKHPDADIGWFAADSLAAIGDPNDIAVIGSLQEATNSADPRMSEHAIRSLEALSQRRGEKANQ